VQQAVGTVLFRRQRRWGASPIDGAPVRCPAGCCQAKCGDEASFTLQSWADVDADSSELAAAEVVIADPPTFASRQATAASLKWLQSTYAGCDALLRNRTQPLPYQVTRLAGVFGPAMAEYVMLHVLALERKYSENEAKQARKEWGVRGGVAQKSYRMLDTLTLGVLGSGDIGMEVAKRANAFGMRVIVCKRDVSTAKPPHVSTMFGPDQLREFLQELDYCVNLLPSTAETRALLSGGTLASCSSAVLINVASARRPPLSGYDPDLAE